MSFTDSIKTGFKNVGHYFAVGFKGLAVGLEDVLKLANKAAPLEPEVEAVVTAIAGPAGAKIADLGFYALGEIAKAVSPLSDAATAEVSAKGLNLTLDAQFIADVKA